MTNQLKISKLTINNNVSPSANFINKKVFTLIFNFSFLIFNFISLLFVILLISSISLQPVFAFGTKPTTKEAEPKYKLEVLKMELVPATTNEFKISSSKKVLMVIAPKDFQDKEFSIPKSILEAEGIKVTVASSTANTAVGMYGSKVKPDALIKNVRASDYDAVVFIGGTGAADYYDDPQALALAIEAKKHDKLIGAICIAPVILAKAGLLEGKKATVSPYGLKDLKLAGATCTGKSVEVDGKIITGEGPAAAEKFGKAILQELEDLKK